MDSLVDLVLKAVSDDYEDVATIAQDTAIDEPAIIKALFELVSRGDVAAYRYDWTAQQHVLIDMPVVGYSDSLVFYATKSGRSKVAGWES